MNFHVVSLATAAAVALSPLALMVPAHAEGPTVLTDFVQYSNVAARTVQGALVDFHSATTGEFPLAGTSATVTVSSCGQVINSVSQTFDGTHGSLHVGFRHDGKISYVADAGVQRVGPQLDVSVTISDPVYGTTHSSFIEAVIMPRPSCAEIAADLVEVPSTGNEIVVKQWSKKMSMKLHGILAHVNSPVMITKTRANGTVSYEWTVGNKVIARNRKVFMKKAYKGKSLKVKIVVTKGDESKSKSLQYGHVRG